MKPVIAIQIDTRTSSDTTIATIFTPQAIVTMWVFVAIWIYYWLEEPANLQEGKSFFLLFYKLNLIRVAENQPNWKYSYQFMFLM